jgi:hypothetical protein
MSLGWLAGWLGSWCRQSKNGSTPLHYFVKIFPSGLEVKKLHSVWNRLLKCQADINLCNSNKEAPLHQVWSATDARTNAHELTG